MENTLYGASFHDPSHIHHCNLICYLSDKSHIVGNKDDCFVLFIFHLFHKFHNLCLNCDIKCSCGFIRNEQIWIAYNVLFAIIDVLVTYVTNTGSFTRQPVICHIAR